ncbi:YigZ family protein [Methylobacillus gramineus]|uniref:IMPACT family protein n=1 Tax=Methylobacillus gramineus TaxID=755169 RepID=UPI001CFFD2F7|nr:YigZ family protein [Methylobacillus gramineus]MCB5184505.1 YigZ family protein [Methylobacillus gramineus]
MQIIIQPGQAEQTINKSRFVAIAEYCADERAVAIALRRLASAHQSAHHLAYAFRLQTPQGVVQRFSDAGEPSGTAGKPVLQFLEGRNLINTCVGVIRYYGGINLGTGGLVRAYGGTAKMALDAASFGEYVEMQKIRVDLDYKKLDGFIRDVDRLNGEVLDKAFGEYVTVIASVPAHEVPSLQQKYG